MKEYKVSIIVPVYNVSEYIERCAISLFEQTFQEIQYVFVNDCTKDDSMSILESTILKYPKRKEDVLIVTHEQNKGIAAVRNTGILNSKGTFVLSVDGDDYVERDIVACMYNALQESNSDIAICDFVLKWERVSKVFYQDIGNSKEDFLNKILSFDISVGLCNKMFRRSLCVDNGVEALVGSNMGEDFFICSKIVYHANKIVKVNKPLYYYIQSNTNSYTKNINEISILSVINVLVNLEHFLGSKSDYSKYKDGLLKGKLRKKLEIIFNSKPIDRKSRLSLFPEIKYLEDIRFLANNEKIINFLINTNQIFLLNIYIKIYKKVFRSVQILKQR